MREWERMLLETSALRLCLSVLQNQPKFHGPEQAGLSKEPKDSQRTKRLEKGTFLFILEPGLVTWK